MFEIQLTKGLVAIVDDEDGPYLSQWKWYAQASRRGFYAARGERQPNGGSVLIYMHRFINRTPDGFVTDHINGDGLDNRKANLRTATFSQNMMNTKPQIGRASPLKGAILDSTSHNLNKWRANIRVAGRTRYLGRFPTQEEAAAAYARAAEKEYGEFHRTNFGETV